ncbi:MAG: hypothetical protein WC601_07935 [Desulfotomaculaceae bacterium]
MKRPVSWLWIEKLDSCLIMMVLGVAVLALAAQAWLASSHLKEAAWPAFSRELERTERISMAGDPRNPVITLRLNKYSALPLARLLVNGEAGGQFKDRYVTVFVREGDLLEIDGTRYDRPFEVEVLDVSGGVVSPVPGAMVKVQGTVSTVGKVRLSER